VGSTRDCGGFGVSVIFGRAVTAACLESGNVSTVEDRCYRNVLCYGSDCWATSAVSERRKCAAVA
jgi:hypothetical protein